MKTLQIIPAENWFARHTCEDGTIELTRVVCWALVQDEDDDRFIEGMIAYKDVGITSCEGDGNFAGYQHGEKVTES